MKFSKASFLAGFTETDMLKLWKGLFYCMWMSDKPLVQVRLVNGAIYRTTWFVTCNCSSVCTCMLSIGGIGWQHIEARTQPSSNRSRLVHRLQWWISFISKSDWYQCLLSISVYWIIFRDHATRMGGTRQAQIGQVLYGDYPVVLEMFTLRTRLVCTCSWFEVSRGNASVCWRHTNGMKSQLVVININ